MPIRTITSADHPHIKHLAKLRLNRDYRHEHRCVVIAGVKPAGEIIDQAEVKSILAYDESFLPKNIKAGNAYIVTEGIMKKASGMLNPEGILIEVAMPEMASLKGTKRILALDGVSDPGNMGALLRTALALGWEGAYILENSCDPFNDKALKAARGATFRLPLRLGAWPEFKELTQKEDWNPLLADLKGAPPEELKQSKKIVLILGNEAHGASMEAKAFAEHVTILMHGPMESLNVAIAGGILLYIFQGKDHV